MKVLFALLLSVITALSQPFTVRDIPFMAQGITDWATRVVANGGAMPSGNTIACMETLRLSLISLGITNKIYSLCIFVPDSLIAATTPLFKHKGADPWTNGNFVIGDLTVNGFKGDGSTKFLDTAVKANNTGIASGGTGSRGLTVLVTETSSNNVASYMSYADPAGTPLVYLFVGATGDIEWEPTVTNPLFFVTTNDIARVGWISGNQSVDGGVTNIDVYVASPLESHKLLIRKVVPNGVPQNTATDGTIPVFVQRHGLTNRFFNAQRMSMAMVHDGFTQTESSNVWLAIKTCRECLGGGSGDPVHNWANKVIVAGGAAISTTTSNANRIFYSGLDTDGLLYQMISVNTYAPDNLTAARIPIHWKSGNQFWTNTSFVAGDITINGLTGNTTTKFLGTGMNISALNYGGFSDTSAGVSLLIYNSPQTATVRREFLPVGSTSRLFGPQHFASRLTFFAWFGAAATVNRDYLDAPVPSGNGTNWAGFMSGSRTANNAIALYVATNNVFQLWTNGTTATTTDNNTITNSFAHAATDFNNTALQWSDRTVSFLAIHSGLSQTQSSNLWIRVQALRTALGGGLPP